MCVSLATIYIDSLCNNESRFRIVQTFTDITRNIDGKKVTSRYLHYVAYTILFPFNKIPFTSLFH